MANNDGVQPSGDTWCKTDLGSRKTSEGTFTWTISGILGHRDMYGNDQGVMSREFTLQSPDGKETKWVLEFVPKHSTNSLLVRVHSRNNFEVQTKMQVTIVQSNGTKGLLNYSFFNAPLFCTLTRGIKSKQDIWRIDWITLTQSAHTNMPNGDLTFNFKLNVYGMPKTVFGSNRLNNVQGPKNSEDHFKVFEEFYLSKEFSDVLIKCQDRSFEAHQLILSASSPVFRGMFQADMKEKKNQQLEIEDIEPDVVVEMLKWCYNRSCVATEENPDLDMVADLLVASDKYQIATLRNVCQSLLSSHLKVDNSLKFLVFGDTYTVQELKNDAMNIVVNNMSELIVTEEWKECKKKRPHIISEVAEAMAKTAS